MCGIVGIISPSNSRTDAVRHMLKTVAHRGPDAQEIWNAQGITLGHTRLSIVDLESGNQPMTDVYGRYTIVFNGEIYGYKKLRDKYSHYPYQTSSDTELILAMLHHEGRQFIHNLPGMFAFAIWDTKTQMLFCGRDRFGEKPFYYTLDQNLPSFIFASEPKAIVRSGLVDTTVDLRSLSHYLKRLYVPANRSIYSHLNSLPPAHSLTYQDGQIKIEKYWNLPKTNSQISYPEAKEHLKHLLRKAVKEQLAADVPVGAFLSGGIDSSSIVAYSASQVDHPLRTYSFGFGGDRNELSEAAVTSKLFNTDHHEFIEDQFSLADLFLQMQGVYDEPFADSSNIPMYIISKKAASELKVVLTGDGGDELLGGYPYWYVSLIQNMGNFNLKRPFITLLKQGKVESWHSTPQRLRRHLLREYEKINALKNNQYAKNYHINNNTFFTDKMIADLGLPPSYDYIQDFDLVNNVEDAMKLDSLNYMPGDILTKTDRASMAHGLELRSPFLNKDLAEFCISLPWRFKLNRGITKYILKDLLNEEFPKLHIQKRKLGFGAPIEQWLNRKDMQELKNELFTSQSGKLNQIFDSKSLLKYTKHNNYKTWIVMVLASWLDQNPHSI